MTSLGSLGTGLPPSAHGMLGYQVAIPGTDRLLNGLNWPKDVDPVEWQPRPTIFERAFAAGVSVDLRRAPGLREERAEHGRAARTAVQGAPTRSARWPR